MMNYAAEMKVRVTLKHDMLGTAPSNPDIYSQYIASKAEDGKITADELESLKARNKMVEEGVEVDLDDENSELKKETVANSITVFHRDPETGKPIVYDYLIKGFFKNACSVLKNCDTAEYSPKIKAFKKYIDGMVFIKERRIPININGKVTFCERPLRASTAQGERVALACSESIPEGSTMEFTIQTLRKDLMPAIIEWLNYGEVNGLGQWHNSGKGSFTWEDITDK